MTTASKSVFDQEILNAYLHAYTVEQRRELQETLERECTRIKALFNDRAATREMPLEAKLYLGGPGTGKTTLMNQDLKAIKSKRTYLTVDFDALVKDIPSLKTALEALHKKQYDSQMAAHTHYTGTSGNIQSAQSSRTLTQWVQGGKFLADSVVNFMAENGMPFALEGIGQSDAMMQALPRLKAMGYQLDISFFAALQDVQITRTKINATKNDAIPFNQSNLIEKTKRATNNLPAMVEQADRLTLLWSEATYNPARPIAVIKNDGLGILDETGFNAFKQEAATYGTRRIEAMLGERATRIQQTKQIQRAHRA